ncbi:hypothetical protein V497_03048 [Pseudogymnoascus sp. VKM F-4516 (FW-969)]|nr:hypothetical protein V497_03048 [Pseudogymnoascus sp. VKM F-4516 (FW-969)]
MHRPHILSRRDFLHLFLRTCALALGATALGIIIHIRLSLHRTFIHAIAATSYALAIDVFVLLLFLSGYSAALYQVNKWLWFAELGAVVLLTIGFVGLLLADVGREVTSNGMGEYVYSDAPDLWWRNRGMWVLLGVLILHFGFMVLGCVDAFMEKRRERFGGERVVYG